jgi:single-strand DNA-binding protein
MSLNHIVLQGRISRDLELKTTNSGMSVMSFPVAVDRDYTKEGQDRTDFINCVAFDKKAEFINRNFGKGSLIVVSGRLQSRKWEDKNGNKRTDWDVIAENVYFGGSKKENTTTKAEPSPDVSAADFIDLEDDGTPLPF